jgi:predicted nucleic acid-binding protein
MPVLDATFLIDLKRRPAKTRPIQERLLSLEEPLLVPMPAAMEYAVGEAEPAAALVALEQSYQVVVCDAALARLAVRLGKRARETLGFPGWSDVQVAAVAAHHGMFVVTRNKRHFRETLGVRVWDYGTEPDPPG